MPKRKRKKFVKPRQLFNITRIKEEGAIVKKYGLKNRREIWKADAAIGRLRGLAKKLIAAPNEEKNDFLKRLQKKGFVVEGIADVLGLNQENWLDRRLQTIVFKKKIANTPKQARQFITHKLISIKGKKVGAPSYFVKAEEEKEITLDATVKVLKKGEAKKEKPKVKVEEKKEDVKENKE